MSFEQVDAGFIYCDYDGCNYTTYEYIKGYYKARLVYYTAQDEAIERLIKEGWYIIDSAQMDLENPKVRLCLYLCKDCALYPERIKWLIDEAVELGIAS